jgi:N-acetylglucosamine-6-phosphate deacetylase
MASLLIRNVRIVQPGKQIVPGDVLIEEGRIIACGSPPENIDPSTPVIEGEARLLTPGLIDVHTHGVLQYAYGTGRDHFIKATQSLGQFGVTTVVPTIVPKLKTGWELSLWEISEAIPQVTAVNIPGLHLEGPFLALPGAACDTISGDIRILDQMLAACQDRVAVMSVSPDTPNIIPIIRSLKKRDIAVFVTHTQASVERTVQALNEGACHATHFYDVFYAPKETEPGVRPVGIVETMLADPRATVDFIADGVHVHPMAIRMAVAAKGYQGVILITDSNIGAGLPEGIYDTPSGFQVRVKAGDAARKIPEGCLAGSALTMNRGIANLLHWLDLPPEQVWAMGTLNPANLLKLPRKGRIEPECDADLVLWNSDLTPARTWVGGRCVYQKCPENYSFTARGY